MAEHAGNWAEWYKGMNPSLRPWRTRIQKRGFVCSLSIRRFPGGKTIQTDLKKGNITLLPPCNSYWWPRAAIFNRCWCDYGIATVCVCVCTVLGRRGWSLPLRGQRWEAGLKDSLADKSGICVTAEWCVLQKDEKRGGPEQLLKFAHERGAASVTHKNCRTASQVWHGNESKKKKEGGGGSDLFYE